VPRCCQDARTLGGVALVGLCLVHVFNHRYEANLDKLDAIYSQRFSRRRAVMPFYSGGRPDVAAVHESSFCFQGYLAQAFPHYASDDVSHYVFLADDMVLHPSLNEDNLAAELGLTPRAGYLKSLTGVGNQPLEWPHLRRALDPFLHRNGVEWAGLLPSADEAAGRLEAQGIDVGEHTWADVRRLLRRRRLRDPHTEWALRYVAAGRGRRRPPYPLVIGYSDLVVVPAVSIDAFVRVCGVLAAMGVFVEAAIPTAMLLTTSEVRTEAEIRWKGREIWSAAEEAALVTEHGASFRRLADSFPSDQLYVHPVKLSKWKGPFA
jgi:hypothetical protein